MKTIGFIVFAAAVLAAAPAAGEVIDFPREASSPVYPDFPAPAPAEAAAPAPAAHPDAAPRPAPPAAPHPPAPPVRPARPAEPVEEAVPYEPYEPPAPLPAPAAPPLVEAAAPAAAEAPAVRPAVPDAPATVAPSPRKAARKPPALQAAAPVRPPWGWIAAACLGGGVVLLGASRRGARRDAIAEMRRRRRVTEATLGNLAPAVGEGRRAEPDAVPAVVRFHDAVERRLRHRESVPSADLVRVARVRTDSRAEVIRDLAEEGEPAVRIARRLGVPLGEVEAVLGVERRARGAPRPTTARFSARA